MSIEKIKERIRMIENDDFSINDNNLVENIKGDEKTIKHLFKPNNKNKLAQIKNKIKRGLGLSDVDREFLTLMGKSSQNTKDIQAAADQLLRRGGRVDLTGQETDLPSNHKSVISKIYGLMKVHNLLTNEINPTNLTATYGYTRVTSPNSNNLDTLALLKSGYVTIQFSDDKLTNLVRINVKNNNKFNNNDFQNFHNELNNNMRNYNIRKVSLTNSNRLITIDF